MLFHMYSPLAQKPQLLFYHSAGMSFFSPGIECKSFSPSPFLFQRCSYTAENQKNNRCNTKYPECTDSSSGLDYIIRNRFTFLQPESISVCLIKLGLKLCCWTFTVENDPDEFLQSPADSVFRSTPQSQCVFCQPARIGLPEMKVVVNTDIHIVLNCVVPLTFHFFSIRS